MVSIGDPQCCMLGMIILLLVSQALRCFGWQKFYAFEYVQAFLLCSSPFISGKSGLPELEMLGTRTIGFCFFFYVSQVSVSEARILKIPKNPTRNFWVTQTPTHTASRSRSTYTHPSKRKCPLLF